jgi:hypothetical protein
MLIFYRATAGGTGVMQVGEATAKKGEAFSKNECLDTEPLLFFV